MTVPISPILLQRRHAELGRIRLGSKESTSNGRTRPAKLDRFRFTSVSERYIRDLAELYGGDARAWDNGGIASWEVFTDTTSIPVIAVKGGLTQWMETWSGGGCTHRCDGEQQADGEPCDPNDPNHQNAKPTTRLSVMLPELEAVGVWRLESHGWNSAAEIPAVAELATFVGDLVPAHLTLTERRAVKDGKTSRFVVPVLDLQVGAARLREIANASSGGQSLAAAAAPAALEAPAASAEPSADDSVVKPPPPSAEQIAAVADTETLGAMWRWAGEKGILTDDLKAALTARATEINSPTAEPTANADGTYDAEVVEDQPAVPADDDADAVWQRILATAGEQGMGESDLHDDFGRVMGGMLPDDATAGELSHYLNDLTGRAAA